MGAKAEAFHPSRARSFYDLLSNKASKKEQYACSLIDYCIIIAQCSSWQLYTEESPLTKFSETCVLVAAMMAMLLADFTHVQYSAV